jgi:creatinine amidohydrolase
MNRFLFAFGLLLAVAVPACAGEVWLENLTWTELRDAVASGATTVIIPVGGTEQSGPHLALGKHNARVRFLAERIAEQAGQTLVAPVIAYVPEGQIDPPTEHMKFPGTISLSDATFVQMLEQSARSLRHAGFTYVVMIGDHGGYQKDLTSAAAALNREWGGKGKALALVEYYALAQGSFDEALRAKGFKDDEIGTHAALADTSLELATAPGMVRQDRLADPASAKAENGVYGGSPARASPTLGQSGVDLIITGTVRQILNFRGGN